MIWQIMDTDQTLYKIEKVENKRPNSGLICGNLYYVVDFFDIAAL
jgi:hypothetical protein